MAAGKRFRWLRQSADLRQADLVAEYAFPSQNTITRFEQGQGTSISRTVLLAVARFARAQGTTLDWIITGHEPADDTISLERLATADQSELQRELGKHSYRLSIVQDFLRQVHNPEMRKRMAEAMAPPDWQPPWPRLTEPEPEPLAAEGPEEPENGT